jgi:PAS domain S-box-containing protein
MLHMLLAQIDLSQIAVALITTVGGAAVVWYRKKFSEWAAFWRSVLDGLRGIPELQNDVKGIRYYVAPNGGGSLMDSAKRTEAAVSVLTEQLDMLSQTMWAENDSDEEVGRYHRSPTGENTYVNQTYARWLGVGKAELLGYNYFNFVHDDDVDEVREEWERCRAERRQFRHTYRMNTANGEVITVTAVATPVPETGTPRRWVGTVRKHEP